MNAEKAFSLIKQAMDDKQPVMVTDGAVTRRVASVGLASGLIDQKFYVHTDCGEWVEIPLSLCGLILDGWRVLETAEGLLIAPEWFIDEQNGGIEK